MSEQLMEQYRLRGQRKCRNACIAAIVTVVLVLAVAGGVWWTAGDGSALVRNMFKPIVYDGHDKLVSASLDGREMEL